MCLTGDWTAFRRIVEVHQGLIFHFLRINTGSAFDVEDLAQRVFIRAYRALPGYDSKYSFHGWLIRKAIDESSEWHKQHRRRRMEDSLDEHVIEQQDLAFKAVQAHHLMLVLKNRLIRRHETYWHICVMRFLEEFSNDDIAAALGVSKSTVERRLHEIQRIAQAVSEEADR